MTLRSLAVAAAGLMSLPCAQAEPPEETLGRVVVVGSRLPRLDAETALPVRIIRREEIERSGVATVEELLDRVSANFGGQREALGLGNQDTPGLSGASLRGFGAGETLVLLNGRRLGNYAFTGTGGPGVDLHAIPLAAIDRVEVLKDGASALYGSDATAGVINFVTRQDFAGSSVTAVTQVPEAGGGKRGRATLTLGHGDIAAEGFNVFGVLDVQQSERLRAADRSFADTAYRPEIGLDSTSPSSYPANIRRRVGSVPSLLNPAAPACTANTVNKGTACFYDFVKDIDILPPSRQIDFLGRGTLSLGTETQGYVEALASTSRVTFTVSPSPASPSTSQAGATFILPESSPYYPRDLGLAGGLNLAYRTAPLGGRTSEVDSENVRLLAGVKSRLAAWDVDSALGITFSRARQKLVSGYVDAGLLSSAIGSGLVNPFGPSAPDGQALLEATQLRGDSRQSIGRTQSGDVRASRELLSLPGGPLGIALGVEARHEKLTDSQAALVADVIGGTPSAPKEGQRNAGASYLELVAPVWKGVEVQAAARVDHYSDFGSSVSPKLALRLQPTDAALLRASIGRGFRAPSLPELYTLPARGFLELAGAGVSDPVRCPVTGLPSDCFPEVTTVSGGNAELKPQRSTQASVGLVFEPGGGVQFAVDTWSIRIRDIIGSVPLDQILGDFSRYDGRNIVRGPVDPAYPDLPGPIVRIETYNENLGDWRVDGTDLSIWLRPLATPVGRFSARLDGTYVRRATQNIIEGVEIDLLERGVAPRWQQVASVNLDRDGWNATLSHRYRRGYDDALLLPDGSTHRVGSYRVWDGQLGVTLGKDVRLTLGVRNLLDTDPPASNQLRTFQLGYDPQYADPLGRTWTVGLLASWR